MVIVWTQQVKFKSWKGLFVFHFLLMLLGKSIDPFSYGYIVKQVEFLSHNKAIGLKGKSYKLKTWEVLFSTPFFYHQFIQKV